MENGLPQNTVQALAQTSDGFLWIGTEVGLVRFDGNGFLAYDQNSKPVTLPGNDIQALLATPDGALWIGTTDGLARLQNNLVTTFTTANGLPSNSIRSIQKGSNNSIVVFTQAGNVALANSQITPASFSSSGILFAGPLISGMEASVNRSVVTLTAKGHNPQTFTIGRDLPGTRIQTAFADRLGSLWIGTNNGLVRFASGKLDRFPLTDPLATASILSILEDHEGNLWVGTESGGLHIIRDERFRTLGSRDGLSSDSTTTVVEDATGALWVGTSGYGLNVVTLSGPTFTKAKAYTVRDGLTSDIILSLAVAPDGDLWAGTPDGLNRIRRGVVTSFTTADGLPDDFIRSLHVDADNSLWVGTRRGLAHLSFAGPAPHIDTYTQATGLGSDLVGAMARDRNGNLWVATLAGLSRLAGNPTPAITNFTTANGLSSNVITSLLPRSNGSLLIGTQDHGWNSWNGLSFSPVANTGLSRATIHAILDDQHDHLWLATANGIARCDCDMNGGCSHWMEFGPADGLRTRQMATNSHPSAWRSHDGLLWFATPKGLVQVDPAHFPVNTVPPPVALVRFAVDDIDQPLNDNALKIPAGHNHFQFDYAGLSFTAPQKVHYRYMLEGFDHQWTDAGSRRSAYYTSIPPGHYTFRVIACNDDGIWNNVGDSFTFDLQPHYYQTVSFRCLCGGLFLLAVIGVYRLRVRTVVRRAKLLEAVVAERTAELIASNDDLQEMQAELEAQNDELLETREFLASANALLEGLATTDGLTGIKNHRAFQECLDQEWKRFERDTGDLSVILIDVDRFKQYNDTYGHPGGDQVLKSVARILTTHARDVDFVARYGGEEFVVVAVDADIDGAMLLAERLRSAVENEPWALREVTASFGVATAGRGMSTPADLIAAADSALYRSKQDGRNRVTHVDMPAMKNAA